MSASCVRYRSKGREAGVGHIAKKKKTDISSSSFWFSPCGLEPFGFLCVVTLVATDTTTSTSAAAVRNRIANTSLGLAVATKTLMLLGGYGMV
ncbi:hypothetical protein LWC05_11495 [Acetobacter sicerae]|uniref:Uncharacterized protein n=1 Tax=Acetobacter sicerae TaxID=85325 RepID=A0ABS8VYM1_9PROT|nr:hypothetical protein [Acetobacter sicerae]MCE0744508.1 hypothetical protein [Acetobacter sicerae]